MWLCVWYKNRKKMKLGGNPISGFLDQMTFCDCTHSSATVCCGRGRRRAGGGKNVEFMFTYYSTI